uniref:CobQ/CobB/MinD/ParA nucleotide binding domain-containing protein n=1 Tax=Geoglobus ahangari TaxID=113653 RepID=A0A7J3TGW3_9EURY
MKVAVVSGKGSTGKTTFSAMIHAMLNPGEENSGKLVTEVRRRADEIAKKEGVDVLPALDVPLSLRSQTRMLPLSSQSQHSRD